MPICLPYTCDVRLTHIYQDQAISSYEFLKQLYIKLYFVVPLHNARIDPQKTYQELHIKIKIFSSSLARQKSLNAVDEHFRFVFNFFQQNFPLDFFL
jgi:hypothetical protein